MSAKLLRRYNTELMSMPAVRQLMAIHSGAGFSRSTTPE